MATFANPNRSVRFRFKNPQYDRIVRLNTEAIARKMGFDEDQVFDLTLAVDEAYANAIEHSRQSLPSFELEIIYHLLPDRLEVSIHDSGCGFEDCSGKQEEIDPDAEATDRGRGLKLIKSLSDKAEIISAPGAGTLIRITKFLAVSFRQAAAAR